jgi:hypothetical protein
MNQEQNLILENNLVNHLRPIQPSPDFIVSLGERLLGKKNIKIENPKFGYAYILASMGLFLGVLVVWLIRRR